MLERVFLGWSQPFLTVATDWLLEHREELPHMLVLVPTSQGARRLREALAVRTGALLSPKMMTPGALLKTDSAGIAPDWMERVAWLETLEGVRDWSLYQDLFPEPPAGADWAGGLAGEMNGLRRSLQENGLTLAAVARILSGTVEAARWNALGRLETLVEARIHLWGFKTRSRLLAAGITLPVGPTRIVLAGVTEMPPLLERALEASEIPVTVLIGAPDAESEGFSPIGRPLACWSERILPWPTGDQGSVQLVADSRQQAVEALRLIAEAQTASDEVALGSADTSLGDEIARVFTKEGWTAFHPAAVPIITGLSRWFKAWSAWLADAKLQSLSVLLSMPETDALAGNRRAGLAVQLSRLRNDWMCVRPDDLRHRFAHTEFRSDAQRDAARFVIGFVETLEHWREDFQNRDFPDAMGRLLDALEGNHPDCCEESGAFHDWLGEAAPLIRQLDRKAGYWIDLMLTSITPSPPAPPDGRVIDVHGWLELFLESGRHLVLCGMNEGSVPARSGADPWLGENAAKLLGLNMNSGRAARDAFLFQSMIEARRAGGRVDLICAKSGSGGEALLPSRFLLAASRDDLPERVRFLFRGIEPPEAGLRWHADWKWQPRAVEVVKRLNVTALTSYLACPFRFYLKHGLGMQTPEPDRVEWNARDFGNVAHDVLERWGRDTEAREFSKTEAIHAWMAAELDKVVGEWFGKRIPLAVRVQTEVLRQRLAWLARVQACSRAEGWEIIEVEHKFEIPVGDATIVAKIDRIDRHRDDGRLRVIDYKTGKVDTVENSHRRKINPSTVLPPHITADCPAVYAGEDKGKPADFLWQNLQLPLYAAAVANRNGTIPTPCYFTLGNTEAEVDIRPWDDFSAADLSAANACAAWIAKQVADGIFWPPAEKATYDDFALLASGRNFDEVFSPIGSGAAQ